MQLEDAVVIECEPDRAWEFLGRVDSVVACVPGAELTEDLGDGSYRGLIAARFGPKLIRLEGRLSYALDQGSRRATLTGSGQERRSRTRAKGEIEMHVVAGDGPAVTRLEISCGATFGGPLASLIEGGGESVAQATIAEFGQNVGEELAPSRAGTAKEAAGRASAVRVSPLRLLGEQLRRLARRLFGRRRPKAGGETEREPR